VSVHDMCQVVEFSIWSSSLLPPTTPLLSLNQVALGKPYDRHDSSQHNLT